MYVIIFIGSIYVPSMLNFRSVHQLATIGVSYIGIHFNYSLNNEMQIHWTPKSKKWIVLKCAKYFTKKRIYSSVHTVECSRHPDENVATWEINSQCNWITKHQFIFELLNNYSSGLLTSTASTFHLIFNTDTHTHEKISFKSGALIKLSQIELPF